MHFNFFRKPITLRQFLFYLLLSPIIFTVVIAIAKILEPSELSSLKKTYECGKFGNQQMRIDRKYLFFAKL